LGWHTLHKVVSFRLASTVLRLTLQKCLYNTFQFAHAYARGEGMKHYTEMVQEPEFAARDKGYTFVSHQQEVGVGYFDDVTTVIQGGSSSVKALTGSTEEEQFH
jgi:isocitrate lyase